MDTVTEKKTEQYIKEKNSNNVRLDYKKTNEYEEDKTITRIIDKVRVNISYKSESAPVTEKEIKEYIKRCNLRNPNTVVSKMDLVIDGSEVEIDYTLAPVPFDRIRRITGYLVGTMDRWNDAKTSEEKDRVKHSIVK